MSGKETKLLLLFETGTGRFVLDAGEVVEIIPFLVLKKIPAAAESVAGLINYHGEAVPVLDLCTLTEGSPCRRVYSTRIILVQYPLDNGTEKLVGLIAEKVTDVIRSDQPRDRRSAGIMIDKALNSHVCRQGSEELVQWFDIARMIPAEAIRGLV